MPMRNPFSSRRSFARLGVALALLAAPIALPTAFAQGHKSAHRSSKAEPRSDAAIRKVLLDQAEAWNRGDLDAFLTGYSDSDATLFVGKRTARGYTAIAASYRLSYPTREKMGKLTFSDLEVHGLDQDYAAVVGKFALKRSPEGGGDAGGIFSLIFENTAQGWKIVLDHTS